MVTSKRLSDAEMDAEPARLLFAVDEQPRDGIQLVADIHSQRADHPVFPTIPESEYLRGYTYELVAAF